MAKPRKKRIEVFNRAIRRTLLKDDLPRAKKHKALMALVEKKRLLEQQIKRATTLEERITGQKEHIENIKSILSHKEKALRRQLTFEEKEAVQKDIEFFLDLLSKAQRRLAEFEKQKEKQQA